MPCIALSLNARGVVAVDYDHWKATGAEGRGD